jgi:hypothetical protein
VPDRSHIRQGNPGLFRDVLPGDQKFEIRVSDQAQASANLPRALHAKLIRGAGRELYGLLRDGIGGHR